MCENILFNISGINNLRSVALVRFIIGILFIIYAVIVYGLAPISEPWTKMGLVIALAGLGITFILDGQNILREWANKMEKDISKF